MAERPRPTRVTTRAAQGTAGCHLSSPGGRLALAFLAAVIMPIALAEGLLPVSVHAPAVAIGLLETIGLGALFVLFVVEGLPLLYAPPTDSLVPAVVVFGSATATLAAILGVAVLSARRSARSRCFSSRAGLVASTSWRRAGSA